MKGLEIARQQPTVPETKTKDAVLLDVIREHLQTDPNVYFAGELTNPEDDGSRFDEHELFIAPRTAQFDPKKLTTFTKKILAGFNIAALSAAQMCGDGDMGLPLALVDQHIGDCQIKTTIVEKVTLGSFKGRVGEKTEDEARTVELIQRIKVKVFTDPLLAQELFDYCKALMNKTLDETQSTNIFGMYATHTLSADHLADLKRHYQSSKQNKLPQLSQAK